jgi:hemerythrin HHE cation binding domain-containing protein
VAPVPDETSGERCLKRDPALVPLSRDHHAALMHALALRRAGEATSLRAATGPIAIAEAFLTFYEEDLIGHMADEEEALLPAVEAVDAEDAARLRREHEDLYEQVALLRQALEDGGDPRGLMREIGGKLHDHVRFEERVFFENVQQHLTSPQLEAMGRAIEDHRRARGRREGCALPPPPPTLR